MAAKGVAQLRVALDRVEGDIRRAVAQAVDEEAAEILADERRLAPVLTGALRAGIRSRSTGELSAEVGIWDPKLFWAIWIEWGRRNAAAQPFVTPAAEMSRRRFPKRVRAAVKRAVDA